MTTMTTQRNKKELVSFVGLILMILALITEVFILDGLSIWSLVIKEVTLVAIVFLAICCAESKFGSVS